MSATAPLPDAAAAERHRSPDAAAIHGGGSSLEKSEVRFWTQVKYLTVFLTAVSAVAAAAHVLSDSHRGGTVIVILCAVVVAAALLFLAVPAEVLPTLRRRPLFFGSLAAGVSVLATAVAWSDAEVVGAFMLLYVVAILIAGIAATRPFVVATGVISFGGFVWLNVELDAPTTDDAYFGVVLLMLVLLTAAWVASAQQDRARRLVTLSDDVAERMSVVEWITDSTPAGICISDTEDRIILANPAACEMLGRSEEELLGASAHETYHHSRPDGTPLSKADCQVQYSIADHVSVPISMVYWRPDGTSFDVEATSIPTPEGGVMVAFTDVSERLAAQRLKDQFMAVISHELRTPLTSVRGALGLMAGGAFGELPSGLGKMVEIAASNTDRLSRLINDVLDVERIASGTAILQPEVFDVMSVIAATIDELRLVAAEDGVDLIGDEPSPVMVFADIDRVHQVMVNLIGNAIKFSSSGDEVAVHVATVGEEARIDIVDRGRGIPAALLEYIFNPFEQVDVSDARVKDGIGLGLAISEGIVRQHGGRIWAESEVGAGSTFSFTLPLAASELVSGRGHGERVLVIDGDDEMRAGLAAMLDNGGYQPVTAATGRAGVEIAEAEHPLGVLLSADLPDMDSWEVIRLLRTGAGTATVAIVLCGDVTAEDRSHLAGAVAAFVDRAVLPLTLLSTVESALRSVVGPVVLIVEDDTDLAGVLAAGLAGRGVGSVIAGSWTEAREWCEVGLPAVILLDLSLPDGSGDELLSWLHVTNQFSDVGLAVYTATEVDVEQRLEMGLSRRDVFVKSRVSPEVVLDRVLQLLDATTPAVAQAPS